MNGNNNNNITTTEKTETKGGGDDQQTLLAALLGATSVARDEHEFSHRLSTFKATIATPESQKRREYYLDRQKTKRRDLLKQLRTLASTTDNDDKVEHNDEDYDDSDQSMSDQKGVESTTSTRDIDNDDISMTTTTTTTVEQEKIRKTQKNIDSKLKRQQKKKQQELSMYSNHLMLAEPMKDVPERIDVDWFAVPAPQGKRCLVVSQRDKTVARSPDGTIIASFSSTLPFGSTASRESCGNINNRFCVLDCLFEPIKSVYYVLDILCWKGNVLCDCNSEFRFFWKQTKLSETMAHKRSQSNPSPFIALPYYDTDTQSLKLLNDTLSEQQQVKELIDDSSYNIEFILFYHKESLYSFGLTPLFLSLSAHHLPTLLASVMNDPNNTIK
ncbi:hypothetical protein SAMD00019534_014410 [Acytostelium subglobosum LB1]|uniref:hypothetical protein n=1 Tax=Acytostelium subglobosum LB1 TaxID=1410327 RepID=UPI0006449AE6|nr:hypothetical protein SAMD00019534_014410 [Acytostelium subglobosum LB1]GAM18266.1 hypothetical protein SAMD00019534_014410 [Acytostelium subglobosum LB1]|eukprot:XP_012758862.1 hypothetical protein SAMD00019534_014410 [Acytostelium subglobosum LB1]